MQEMIAVELDRATPAAIQLLGKLVEDLRNSGHVVSHSMVVYGNTTVTTTFASLEAARHHTLPPFGSPFQGGFFAGVHELNNTCYALIVAPKALGEKLEVEYKSSDRGTPDRTNHDDDGVANGNLINDDNHPAAQFCLSRNIAGCADWYPPSRDELAMIERNLGLNRAKTPDLFKAGGAEAFEERWYWTSTESASIPYDAWLVGFGSGYQTSFNKGNSLAVRAVRRLPI